MSSAEDQQIGFNESQVSFNELQVGFNDLQVQINRNQSRLNFGYILFVSLSIILHLVTH